MSTKVSSRPNQSPPDPNQMKLPLPTPANDDSPVSYVAEPGPAPDHATANCLLVTLADLHAWLGFQPRDQVITNQRSAINTVARALGKAPAEIPLDPVRLGPLLAESAPAMAGIKPARWRQARSQLRTAAISAGVRILPGRSGEQLSEAWEALVQAIEVRRMRLGVTRLVRRLSNSGVAPDQLTSVHLESFRELLITRGLHRNPTKMLYETARQWNRAVASVPGWPQFMFPKRSDPRRYALPIDAFPDTFVADLGAYLGQRQDPDPFSEDWHRAARPKTIEARRKQLLQIASALVHSGTPIRSVTSIETLTTLEHAQASLGWLRARKGRDTQHLGQQAQLLAAVARHWVKVSEKHYTALRGYADRLTVTTHGMTEKNRAHMRQFDLPENVAALLTLPVRVLSESGDAAGKEISAARRIMRAVAVEILLMAPIRLKNLTELEIGKNLVETRRGSSRLYHIVLPPHLMKNEYDLEIELPEETSRLIDVFLTRARPLLAPPASTALFPNDSGSIRNPGAMGRAIQEFITRETGLKLTPHQFRHLGGKLFLQVYPQGIETVRQVMAHKSLKTTEKNYVQVRRAEAFRSFDAALGNLRADRDRPSSPNGRGPSGRRRK